MSDTPLVGAFAIVPSNDLAAAIPFWIRLGFARAGGDANYIIMTRWGCEVHLTQAGPGPWRVPEDNNPFGVSLRTPDVDITDVEETLKHVAAPLGGSNDGWGCFRQSVQH